MIGSILKPRPSPPGTGRRPAHFAQCAASDHPFDTGPSSPGLSPNALDGDNGAVRRRRVAGPMPRTVLTGTAARSGLVSNGVRWIPKNWTGIHSSPPAPGWLTVCSGSGTGAPAERERRRPVAMTGFEPALVRQTTVERQICARLRTPILCATTRFIAHLSPAQISPFGAPHDHLRRRPDRSQPTRVRAGAAGRRPGGGAVPGSRPLRQHPPDLRCPVAQLYRLVRRRGATGAAGPAPHRGPLPGRPRQ